MSFVVASWLATPGVARAESLDLGVPCQQDVDCEDSQFGPYCDDGMCQECIEDMHCAAGAVCTRYGHCYFPCVDDQQCPPALPLCNVASARCVSCLDDGDCGDGEYCTLGGECAAQTCEPGTFTCVGNSRRECSENGASFVQVEGCGPDATCQTAEGRAWCEPVVGTSTGGAADGASTATSGGSATDDGADPGGGTTAQESAGCAGCRVPAPGGPSRWAWVLLLGAGLSAMRRRA